MLALRAHDRTQPRSCHSPPAQKPAHAIALPPPLALSSPKIVTIKSRRKDALHIALTKVSQLPRQTPAYDHSSRNAE